MNKVSIGSVSSGTMRPEDLYDSFTSELRYIDPARAMEFDAEWIVPETDEDLDTFDQDALDEFYADAVNALFDLLGEYAPDYCYFGANEGDGADYGYWPCWDFIKEARLGSDPELDSGEDLPDFPHDKPFLLVNDHGNATLYSADGVELWACV
jgi:hypothetical protein